MRLPEPRGPLTSALLGDLAGRPLSVATILAAAEPRSRPIAATCSPTTTCSSPRRLLRAHYRGFDDVADDWEWEPGLLAPRAGLEQRHLAGLRAPSAPCRRPTSRWTGSSPR